MNNFLYNNLLDSYNWNKDVMIFCDDPAELFIKPFFSLDKLNLKKSIHFDKMLSEQQSILTLFYSKNLLPHYGFNKEKLKKFTDLKMMELYSEDRIGFKINLETVFAHYVLINFYDQHFREPNEALKRNSYLDPAYYIYKSVKYRIALSKLAKESGFTLHKIPLQPIYQGFEWYEKILFKLFSIFGHKYE